VVGNTVGVPCFAPSLSVTLARAILKWWLDWHNGPKRICRGILPQPTTLPRDPSNCIKQSPNPHLNQFWYVSLAPYLIEIWKLIEQTRRMTTVKDDEHMTSVAHLTPVPQKRNLLPLTWITDPCKRMVESSVCFSSSQTSSHKVSHYKLDVIA
jgi:hypothetical protein